MGQFPMILQGKWADGWTILAIPKDGRRILKYSELKKEIHENFMNMPSEARHLVSKWGNFPFTGGWVGFLSYDLGAKFVGIRQKVKDDLGCPEVYFTYCDRAFLKDPQEQWWRLDLTAEEPVQKLNLAPSKIYDLACARAQTSGENLNLSKVCLGRLFSIKNGLNKLLHGNSLSSWGVHSNLNLPQYCQKLETIKKYLFQGDTYQVNFSQRFSVPFSSNPFSLFQKISQINPSPYQFYCYAERSEASRDDERSKLSFAVISNSPELLVRGKVKRQWVEQRIMIETRPIKGTVLRGKNETEEAKNIKKLLRSEKENAELTMIVDLERNDLGRVCLPESIFVRKHRAIERYSHVIHTVSTIEGLLERRKDVFDVLQAIFPGGSITGCPKKRTMEIIDELEDFKRGVYCGSAGYISLNGNFEFNIMIRTMFLKNGMIYFHSGGGIVADSHPKAEYEETIHKAAALVSSLSYYDHARAHGKKTYFS